MLVISDYNIRKAWEVPARPVFDDKKSKFQYIRVNPLQESVCKIVKTAAWIFLFPCDIAGTARRMKRGRICPEFPRSIHRADPPRWQGPRGVNPKLDGLGKESEFGDCLPETARSGGLPHLRRSRPRYLARGCARGHSRRS